jgi:NAD-dependent dihydropyrimidine dehydrogenase PreA subunit
MGEFIKVEIDLSRCAGRKKIAEWVRVCPVNIFKMEDKLPVVVEENEDECTLCMLCVEAFPKGAITIHKLYEA